MKKLCLFRHSKSTYGALGVDDLERPLHEVGYINAPLMGEVLKKTWKFKPDLILASHAQRALLTAELLCGSLNYDKEKIRIEKMLYEAGVEDLLHTISQVKNTVRNLMIVGHNPGLTLLANFLTDGHVNNLPTSGVVIIQSDAGQWESIGTANNRVLCFDEPKNHQ